MGHSTERRGGMGHSTERRGGMRHSRRLRIVADEDNLELGCFVKWEQVSVVLSKHSRLCRNLPGEVLSQPTDRSTDGERVSVREEI